MIRPFQLLPTTDDVLNRIQRNVEAAFQRLVKLVPLLDGVLLEDVVITSGSNQVDHGLDRKPLGFLVVKKNATADIYDGGQPTLATRTINLVSSANVVVSLWVF